MNKPEFPISAAPMPLLPVPFRWWMRRYRLKHLWYRVRLPYRRRRWLGENETTVLGYQKSATATSGAEPVLIVGDLSGAYGLSRGAAYDVEAIKAMHQDVTIIDIGAALYNDKVAPNVIDRTRRYGTAYLLCQPDMYKRVLPLFDTSQLRNTYRIGRWVWETPIFPTAWRFAPSIVHEIWTPSQFCAETFRRGTGLPTKVWQHPVTLPAITPLPRRHFDLPAASFVGLAIMDILSCPERKNPWDHVRAWQLAFGTDPTAMLVLKLRTGKRTRLVLDELRDLAAGAGNIRILCDELSSEELFSLQTACDVYLSLHRAEGFGLNIAECLQMGKHVVATDWSANAEYGPSSLTYHGIRYGLVPYRDWLLHYEDAHFEWAQPDLEHASLELRQLRQEIRQVRAPDPATGWGADGP